MYIILGEKHNLRTKRLITYNILLDILLTMLIRLWYFFWKRPTSCKCYSAKEFKFKPQRHISLATFPNLHTLFEVFEIHIDMCRWKARCWNGFYWVSLFGCTMYEHGGENRIVRGLGYIHKWKRCDNETPKWKWFGKMIGLIFVEVQDMEAFELLFSRHKRWRWTIFKAWRNCKTIWSLFESINRHHIVLVSTMEQSKIFSPLITITKTCFFCYKIVIKVILKSLLLE